MAIAEDRKAYAVFSFSDLAGNICDTQYHQHRYYKHPGIGFNIVPQMWHI